MKKYLLSALIASGAALIMLPAANAAPAGAGSASTLATAAVKGDVEQVHYRRYSHRHCYWRHHRRVCYWHHR